MASDLGGEVAELLQAMIRNACVNDGTPESGHEQRNAEVLESLLEGRGLDMELHEPLPGRSSLVARIEGRDHDAPALALLGHTDVVPANGEDWRHDPFGGEIIDGEVWGRGAVDMLNLTASQAVALKGCNATDEDVLTYAMFPQVAPKFFAARDQGPKNLAKAPAVPAPAGAPPAGSGNGKAPVSAPVTYDITVGGKSHKVTVEPA